MTLAVWTCGMTPMLSHLVELFCSVVCIESNNLVRISSQSQNSKPEDLETSQASPENYLIFLEMPVRFRVCLEPEAAHLSDFQLDFSFGLRRSNKSRGVCSVACGR